MERKQMVSLIKAIKYLSKSNGIIYYIQNVEGLFAIITFNFHGADVSIN